MRYYANIWPVLKAHVVDRPLVLKRYPEGAGGPMFFQQNAGEHVPDVVRVEAIDSKDDGPKDRIIGGDLATLLYTVQIGAIEVHPKLSQVGDIDAADRCLIDLDPGPEVPFGAVVALTRDVLNVVHCCALPAAVKTSGSSGMHVVIPLPRATSYQTSSALAMLVARVVTAQTPERATVERSLRARPPGTIYVDAMQNARGRAWRARTVYAQVMGRRCRSGSSRHAFARQRTHCGACRAVWPAWETCGETRSPHERKRRHS